MSGKEIKNQNAEKTSKSAAQIALNLITSVVCTTQSPCSDTDTTDQQYYGRTLSQAIAYAQSKGIAVVTAAGNRSWNADTAYTFYMPGDAGNPTYNGLGKSLNNIIVTAAVDGSNALTQYSNWGPTSVNLGAPTGSGTDAVTSYSTGYTSGVMGAIAALAPTQTPAQWIGIVEQTVTPATQTVGAWCTTGGVINPAAAVSKALNSISIAAGSTSGTGSFLADTSFASGGSSYPTTHAIDTTGVSDPPPQSVLQTERWDSSGAGFTETLPGLTPNTTYNVRLDFSENFPSTTVGQRVFDVAINGVKVLNRFDILQTAGAQYKLVAPSFPATTDQWGKISVTFTTDVGSAKVDAIEVTPLTSSSIAIAAGSMSAIGNFVSDTPYASGNSSTYPNTHAIDTSAIPNPPPVDVFHIERWSNSSFTETIPNLTPNAAYDIRLDFAEAFYSGAGSRSFNVAINGAPALTNFDIAAAAGGKDKAVAVPFNHVAADSSGHLAITFTNVAGGAKVDGIEVSPSRTIALASGNAGPSNLGDFSPDTGYSPSSTYPSPGAVDTSGIANPPPATVFANSRYSLTSFSYSIPNLTPNANYNVRLDFAETYFSGPGSRSFDVLINYAAVLTNFDIAAAAGGANKAVAESFNATADGSGTLTITFANNKGGATVNGVEVSPSLGAPQATQVDLSGLYNAVGITNDNGTSAGNFDGAGNSYSSTFVGPISYSNGVAFKLGPAGANDVVVARGQTITLPSSGNYGGVRLLGTGLNGLQGGAFTIYYTDGTSSTINQNFDDWHNGASASGESVASLSPYRNGTNGRDTNNNNFYLYSYSIAINPTKRVASIILPTNSNIAIFALDLVP